MNKKREIDMAKLRKDIEEQSVQHEQTVASMRSKQQSALAEMQEEIDALKKSRSKWDLLLWIDLFIFKFAPYNRNGAKVTVTK